MSSTIQAERIYLRHVRANRFCARGLRHLAKSRGLDYSDFLRNGIERQRAVDLGDAMVNRAIALADQEAAEMMVSAQLADR